MKRNKEETLQLKDAKNSYFIKMMMPDAEKKARLYIQEEKNAITHLLSSTKNLNTMNFIVVGAGTLWYIELAFEKVKNYIAIEPLANAFIQKQLNFILSKHSNIKIIAKELGKFKKSEIPNNQSIFIFHFNVLAYIPCPIKKINKYLRRGDILYFSTWGNSEKAKKTKKEYFKHLGLDQAANPFEADFNSNKLCDFDTFPFDKLKYYKTHKRIKGKIADILIIYC